MLGNETGRFCNVDRELFTRFQASKIRQAQPLLRLSGTNSELNYVNPRF